MKRKVQAQRKFAQGAPIPSNAVHISEKRVDVTPYKEGQRNTIRYKTSFKTLLDVISLDRIHKHKLPIVLLKRLKTNPNNPYSVNENEESYTAPVNNDSNINNFDLTADDDLDRNLFDFTNDNNSNKSTMRLRSHNSSNRDEEDSIVQFIEPPDPHVPHQNIGHEERYDGKPLQIAIEPYDSINLFDMTQIRPLPSTSRSISSNMSDVSMDEDKPLAQYVLRKKQLSITKATRQQSTVHKKKEDKVLKKVSPNKGLLNVSLRRTRRKDIDDSRNDDPITQPQELPVLPLDSKPDTKCQSNAEGDLANTSMKTNIESQNYLMVEANDSVLQLPENTMQVENKQRSDHHVSCTIPLKKRRITRMSIGKASVTKSPTMYSSNNNKLPCPTDGSVDNTEMIEQISNENIASATPTTPNSNSVGTRSTKATCKVKNYSTFAEVMEAPIDHISNRCRECYYCKRMKGMCELRVIVDVSSKYRKSPDNPYVHPEIDSSDESYFTWTNSIWKDKFILELDILQSPKKLNLRLCYCNGAKNRDSKPVLICSLVPKLTSGPPAVEAQYAKVILLHINTNFNFSFLGNESINFETQNEKVSMTKNNVVIVNKNVINPLNDSCNLDQMSNNQTIDSGVVWWPKDKNQKENQSSSNDTLQNENLQNVSSDLNSTNNEVPTVQLLNEVRVMIHKQSDNNLLALNEDNIQEENDNSQVLFSHHPLQGPSCQGEALSPHTQDNLVPSSNDPCHQTASPENSDSRSQRENLQSLSDQIISENEIHYTCAEIHTYDTSNMIYNGMANGEFENSIDTRETYVYVAQTTPGCAHEENRNENEDTLPTNPPNPVIDANENKPRKINNILISHSSDPPPGPSHIIQSINNGNVAVVPQPVIFNPLSGQINPNMYDFSHVLPMTTPVINYFNSPVNISQIESGCVQMGQATSTGQIDNGHAPITTAQNDSNNTENVSIVNNTRMNQTGTLESIPVDSQRMTSNELPSTSSRRNVCEPSTSSAINHERPFCSLLDNNRSKTITHSQPSPGKSYINAPVFTPTAEEFTDPISYFESIAVIASKFGICKVVPPKDFKPSCALNDEMMFNVSNQYVTRLYSRWGPGSREMSTIKAYLASQSVIFKRAPLYEGMEVNLPKLYQIVQRHGGLKKVIERKRWSRVAEEIRFTRGPNPEKKLDQFYVKYLLPYDTLSPTERGQIMSRVERAWCERYRKMTERAFAPIQQPNTLLVSESSSEEDDSENADNDPHIKGALTEAEECVMQGRKMNLTTFKKVAAHAQEAFFPNSSNPSTADVEEEYWRLVLLGSEHMCVICASIDTGTAGYGFTRDQNDAFATHPWNLKNLATNKNNILRYLGSVLGVTVPTLHLGMIFATSCWHRDPHALPWMEYMHSGPTKIWYGIPDEQSIRFRKAVETLCPTSCQNKTIWLPSDIAMIPPNLLREQKVTLSRVEQNPGEYIIVFPKAFSCSISTGFTVSESVYFAHKSWLHDGLQFFLETESSSEPTMISIESLLISMVSDVTTPLAVLQPALAMLKALVEAENLNRMALEDELSPSMKSTAIKYLKHAPGVWNVRDQDECGVCRKSLYVSRVHGLTRTDTRVCLDDALNVINLMSDDNRPTPSFTIDYHFTMEELQHTLKIGEKRLCKIT